MPLTSPADRMSHIKRLDALKQRSFYECGCCDHLHRVDWHGDCREDLERFTFDELDQALGCYSVLPLEEQSLDT